MFPDGQLERDSIETLKELLEDKLSEYKIAVKFMLAYNLGERKLLARSWFRRLWGETDVDQPTVPCTATTVQGG
jgi:hypothetical protein